MTHRLEQLRAAPFLRGGRGPDGVDCLGVVLAGAAQLGNPIEDPWLAFCAAWSASSSAPTTSSGFPATWRRIEFADTPAAWCGDVLEGDVWLWHARPGRPLPGCGIVYRGRIWTATPAAGVLSLEPHRAAKPDEVWRP